VLGLAVATDDSGLYFRDLGTIVEPSLQSGQAEVGGGSFAVVDSHLYVYYRDWFEDGSFNNLSVARAPIDELVNNALNWEGTEFTKYFDGNWSEPGRGGLSSPLEIGNPANSWSAVSYNDYLDQLVLVTSQWDADGGDLYLTTSHDGLNWSERQAVDLDPGEQFYPSLIGTGYDPTHTGESFYVYYTDSKKGGWNRWKDAKLVRREVTLYPEQEETIAAMAGLDFNNASDFDFLIQEPAPKYALAQVAAIPEPGTCLLVCVGCAIVFAASRFPRLRVSLLNVANEGVPR
jgi:hypothetical protein